MACAIVRARTAPSRSTESTKAASRSISARRTRAAATQQDDFVTDCSIDTDLEILIPDNYVESITERLSLYSRLDNCENEEDLTAFHAEMTDRFGPIPDQVEDLFTTVRCRKIAVELGFEKMFLKNNSLKCFFVSNPDSPYFQSKTFTGILSFLQTGTNKGKLKQVGKNGILVVEDVKTMSELYDFLKKMIKGIPGKIQ